MTLYTDFDLTLKKHPVTKDILPVSDDVAIKRSILHLLETRAADVPFHPEKASDLESIQFEFLDFITLARVERVIKEVIGTFEPRAKILAFEMTPVYTTPVGLKISMTIGIVNTNNTLQFDHYLSRTR